MCVLSLSVSPISFVKTGTFSGWTLLYLQHLEQCLVLSKTVEMALTSVSRLDIVLQSEKSQFNSQSELMPGMWVWSPVRVRTTGNLSINVSLIAMSLFFSFSLPSPLSENK